MTSVKKMLNEMTAIYEKKREAFANLRVGLLSLPDEEKYFLDLSKKTLKLQESLETQPEIIFKFSKETLKKIFSCDLTGFTAVGRENMEDQTPLDLEFNSEIKQTPELMNQIYAFVQKFFNPTYPEKILIDKTHARLVHGAWGIPMFYHTGFRSGWYQVDKGQSLNKPGDTNPFPQAFIIFSGQGILKLDGLEIQVKPGEAYYIPPGSEHVLRTVSEASITLMYLAWGKKA